MPINPDYSVFKSLSVDNTEKKIPKPHWLKVKRQSGSELFKLQKDFKSLKLHTVCQEAKCPNITECLNSGTATFMVLGDICTRGCAFCSVKTGNPKIQPEKNEPQIIAKKIKDLGITYAVITTVDRDDLDDFGAKHLAQTVKIIKELNPTTDIEVLAGDFKGNQRLLELFIKEAFELSVFAHNIETVKRLSHNVRDKRANYSQSLNILKWAKEINPSLYLKSGIMLGLGEESEEICECINDLLEHRVDILTIGQYLQPTSKQLAVKRYAHPWEFDYWKEYALKIGFKSVASGPLVRSSYKASNLFFSNKNTEPTT